MEKKTALITGSYGGLGNCFVEIHAGQLIYDTCQDNGWEVDYLISFAAKVRCALTELLPGGEGTADAVAAKLAVSKRTLQRKLAEEQTSFQKQLNETRALLAKHYIRCTDMSSDDIAFLLGYQESNSFLRAFHLWTGMGFSEYRKTVQ